MFVAAIISLLLAAALAYAAARKLSHRPEVVAEYARVGVPENRLDQLAVILLAGATGLLVGLAWAPVGIAAAFGLVLYFATAVGFHIRFGDLRHAPTPLALAALALLILVLRLATD